MFGDVWGFVYEHARVAGVLWGGLAIAAMTATTVVRRKKMPRRTRRVFFWLYLMLVNGVYGTGYNLNAGFDATPPAFIAAMLFMGLALAAIWHPEGDDRVPGPDDKSTTTRFLMWLDRRVVETKEKRRSQ